MTPERYERVSDLFLQARRKPAADRDSWLDEACNGDASLAGDVRNLLDSDSAGPFLDTPAAHPDDCIREPRPHRIGRYRILDLIGEGGMGVVYRAEQESPKRIVALKVIRPGLLTPSALRRFEHEAAALGRLRHPGVAQILEAGADGPRPYLAMEYIEGTPLTEFIRDRSLTIRQTVELFALVCDAVHHAHQRGVIHRDLKPANILVEDSGQPKVVDFGIARATGPDADTVQTITGQLVGTLQYMSPEQVGGHPEDLDTRSDVYALGVILYELLVGKPPYDVSSAPVFEAGRIIRDQDAAPAARTRRELAGDLDAILGMALEKDRAHRYQSAAALADDLRRYLTRQPVTARPQTTFYHLRRFAARNRTLVGLAAAVAVTLLAGLVTSSIMYFRADAARARLADEQQATARQAARADRVKNYVVEMFNTLNPVGGGQADMTARDMVNAAAARLQTQLADDPEVRADVLSTIGHVYEGLGLDDQARDTYRQVRDLRLQTRGPESVEYADALLDLARGPWTRESLTLCNQAIAIYRAKLGADGVKTVHALGIRAAITSSTRKLSDSWSAMVDAALAFLMIVKDSDFPEDIAAVLTQARKLHAAGDLPAVRRLFFDYRETVNDRIAGMWSTGDREGAFQEIRRHYAPLTRLRFLPAPIPYMLTGVALVMQDQGEPIEAVEALLREAVNYGRDHPGKRGEAYRHSLLSLAEFLRNQHNADDAEGFYREALNVFSDTSGAKSDTVGLIHLNLAMLRHAAADEAAAEAHARDALSIARAALPESAVLTVETQCVLGEILQDKGDLPGAEAMLRECLQTCRESLRRGDWHMAEAQSALGDCLRVRGQVEEARQLLTDACTSLNALQPDSELARKAKARLDRLPPAAAAATRVGG